jgi:hypothetical protein
MYYHENLIVFLLQRTGMFCKHNIKKQRDSFVFFTFHIGLKTVQGKKQTALKN